MGWVHVEGWAVAVGQGRERGHSARTYTGLWRAMVSVKTCTVCTLLTKCEPELSVGSSWAALGTGFLAKGGAPWGGGAGIPAVTVAFGLFLLPAGIFVGAINSAVPGEFIAPGEALFTAWEHALILILSQRNVS